MPARKKKAEATASTLDEALANIQRKRGLAIGTVTEAARSIEALSSGNIALDYVTGIGGFPRGRIIELFGKPSSGKSTAALHAIAEARRRDLVVAYFDYESATDPTYVRAFGLDPDDPKFIFATPDTLEDGMNALRDLLRTGQLAVGVVDSVAAMVSEKEMEADTGEQGALGAKGKMMYQSMRQMTGLANKHGSALLFVNHEVEVIDTSPMGQRMKSQGIERVTTPGGNALKFFASLRIRFRMLDKEKRKVDSPLADADPVNEPFANNVRVTVEKNKVGVPGRSAELRLDYGRGFSQPHSVMNVLLAQGRAKKKAAGYYDLPDPETGEVQTAHGEQAVLRLIEDKLDLYAAEALSLLEEATRPPTPEELAEMEAMQEAEDARIQELLDVP